MTGWEAATSAGYAVLRATPGWGQVGRARWGQIGLTFSIRRRSISICYNKWLVEDDFEQRVRIAAFAHLDLDWRAGEPPSGRQAGEAPAHDHHPVHGSPSFF